MKHLFWIFLLLAFLAYSGTATEEGWRFNGVLIAKWAGQGFSLACLMGAAFCLYGMWKEKRKPKEPEPPLDEQYAQAKAELDWMYFREHGKMPEWPEAEASEEKEK